MRPVPPMAVELRPPDFAVAPRPGPPVKKRKKRRKGRAWVLQVRCPVCNQAPGKRCVYTTQPDKHRSTHRIRMKKSKAWFDRNGVKR